MPEAKTKNIYQKLVEVRKGIAKVPKRGRNEFQGYDYATEADILEAVNAGIDEQGLWIIPSEVDRKEKEITSIDRDGRERKYNFCWIKILYTIVDSDNPDSGKIEAFSWGSGVDSGDKALYKAKTGASKYFFTKMFRIPTGDDPEREEGAGTERPSSPEKPVAAPPLVDKGKSNPFLTADEVKKIWEAWRRNEASDKKRMLMDYLADITEILIRVNEDDINRGGDMLSNYSAFQGKDGNVASTRDIEKLRNSKIGWSQRICHKLEKDYPEVAKEVKDLKEIPTPDEVDAFFEAEGEVP